MSKRFLALMAVAALAILPFGSVHADPGPEGCAVVAGEGDASGTVSESAAGYGIVGGGSFKVERTRTVDNVTTTVTLVEREHAVPEVKLDADIQAGDILTCTADQGAVAAGKVL